MLASPGSPVGDADRDLDLINPASVAYTQAQYEFNRAIKADYGYNTQYFSVMNYCPSIGMIFMASGTEQSRVNSPADTILFVNSVWDRTSSGAPRGGGNWGIDPPCRRLTDGTDTLPPVASGCSGRWWWGGWRPDLPLAWNVFGGAWPYHGEIANVGWADGHATPKRISQLTAGCNVLPSWTAIFYPSSTSTSTFGTCSERSVGGGGTTSRSHRQQKKWRTLVLDDDEAKPLQSADARVVRVALSTRRKGTYRKATYLLWVL
ncbi:MAG: hypothetical protein M5U21_00925 [Fimbriimonadaceae bacterium]|nr:hypothetical protein [Fimbriimonadaceae bacterium]